MTSRAARGGILATALLLAPSALLAQVQITTVLSGLTQPVFVGHAGDGSNRLFVVERTGKIRVAQPGSATTTVFLDLSAKITTSGGEQGLLGLAFHPAYETNGRFFVFYTKAGTGALVVAEYGVSSNTNVANTLEKPLLEIAHPTYANHNGGMLAFGPDGYLYIGVGDGGSGNDPNNHAQNKDSLLGKILRIDINTPGGYLSPTSNPFYGAVPGREEVFAYGIRNPWRFSFDRLTGQMWVGDVGQGSVEEIDSPILRGGNYGWRIYEGTSCTNIDPGLCSPANVIGPVVQYAHAGGRCSVTGGYVYRGLQNSLPAGTYIYGDYCTGEIFARNGGAPVVLLPTGMRISSFGEDEAGELYVVNFTGGTVGRLRSVAGSCTYAITPISRTVSYTAIPGTITVTARANCSWTSLSNDSWLRVTSGVSGTGNGSVGYAVSANTGSVSRRGTMTIAGQTFTVTQGASSCTGSLSPTSRTTGIAATTGSVAVSVWWGCTWKAVSNVSWITVTGGSSGSGKGTVTYSVAKYTGSNATRTGTLTIAKKTFTITQKR